MSETYIFDQKETALIGDVLFSNLDPDVQIVSGTGLIQPFVRIEERGTEEGFNYDLAVDPAQQQDYPMDVKDRQQLVNLDDVNIVIIDNIAYYEFRLDVNEPNNTAQKWISLDALKIYASNEADLYGLTNGTDDTWNDLSLGGTVVVDPIFSLDSGGVDRTIFLDGNLQAGSGKSDLAVFVPVDSFEGKTYAYFYSAFGYSDSTDPALDGDSHSGFEEWAYVKKVFEAAPGIAIDKVTVDGTAVGDGITVLAGETVTWRYTVTNTGNVELSAISLTDDQLGDLGGKAGAHYVSGDTDNDGNLDLTETWIFEAAGTAVAGDYANIGSVSGTFGATTVTDDDPSSYFGADPQIAIDKVTFDGATSGDGLTILTGESIGWRYTVTNVGNVALASISVTDSEAGVTPVYVSGDDGDGLLEDGEAWIYEATGVAITGAYANTGTASGSFTDDAGHSRTDTATDTSSYFGADPQIAIDKVTLTDCAEGDGITVLAGESVTWRYSVTNAGNVVLADVSVTDSEAGVTPVYVSGDDGDDLLEAGETWIYEATGTAITGAYTNTGTASGSFTDDAGHSRTDTATDTSSYFGANPLITLDKVTSDASKTGDCIAVEVGTAITWTYTVTNTGNVALANIVLTDDQEGAIDLSFRVSSSGNDDDILDAGEVWVFEVDGTAGSGLYENIATVSGDYANDDLCDTVTVDATDDSCYYGIEFEGLTPGFWGQLHNWSKVTLSLDCKEEFGVSSWSEFFHDLTLREVFGVDDYSFGKGKSTVHIDADMTLYQAVNFNPVGGGAEAAMVRHVVAALANACAEEVTYFYGHDDIIGMVQDAWGDRAEMTEVRDDLQEQNELGLLEEQMVAITTAWQANPDMVFA